MAVTRLKPHRRVVIGRNITLVAAIIYSLARAALYLNGVQPGGTAAFLTANGAATWVWALAWATAAALCVVDIINNRTRYGLSLVVGLATAWGAAYTITWVLTGFTGSEWISAIGWLTPAALIFGFLVKVTALHDMLNPDGAGEEQVANG